MQNLSFVGKIYGLEFDGKPGKDGFKAKFRLSVRKKFVTKEDRDDGKTQVFFPCIAFGKTAELLNDHFQDGSIVGVNNCEYSTWESGSGTDKKYFHNFKVGGIDFIPTENGGQGGGNSNSSSSSNRSSGSSSSSRRSSRDEEPEDDRSSRRSSNSRDSGSSRRSSNRDEEEDDRKGGTATATRGRSRDDDDDDVPF